MARRRLKLIFSPSLVTEPVIYQLGKQFAIVTNIRRADVTRDEGWVLLEITGEPPHVDAVIARLEPLGIIEMVRTGQVAMRRGDTALSAAQYS